MNLKYSEIIISKAKEVNALIFDVDGVLTNGAITYSGSGEELKTFNVKDGQIIKHLKSAGIIVGAITGRSSGAVERRCKELNLDFYFQGVKDKWAKTEEIMQKFSIMKEQICYIGDDIIDLKVINKVGLGVCPADALSYVKEKADYVSHLSGGAGVVREIGDLLLHAQGKLSDIVNSYLK